MRKHLIMMLAASLLLIFAPDAQAQEGRVTDVTCPALVQQALDALGDNCSILDRNRACYGYAQVDSTFNVEVAPGFFSQPSDQTELVMLSNIRTMPLDLQREQWGIAMMNVQANVPGTFPGQNVTFIMLGDAQVENAVDPSTAMTPAPPVAITVSTVTEARSGPGLNNNTVGTIPVGTQFEADALSREGDWLRVLHLNRPAWVQRSAVEAAGDLNTLPVVTSLTRTPMQSFYFSTGFGNPECGEAHNAVAIHSPGGMTVDLTVNGVDIRVGSLITLQTTSPDQLVLTVHEGRVETVDGQVIETGQTIEALTADDGQIIGWEGVRPVNETEMDLGALAQQAVLTVDPGALAAEDCGTVTHVVSGGQTLFSIARQYNASMPEIIAANAIANPNALSIGLQLTIPNACAGFVSAPTISAPPATAAACEGFRPTSPLNGLNLGLTQFFWDGAAAATNYRVNVYNLGNGRSVSFTTAGAETTVSGDVSSSTLGDGFDFAWEVEALRNGQSLCLSQRIATQRTDLPAGAFRASWGCSAAGVVDISYQNVPQGDTVTISFFNSLSGTTVTLGGLPVPPNSTTYSPVSTVSNGMVTTSSGASYALPPMGGGC